MHPDGKAYAALGARLRADAQLRTAASTFLSTLRQHNIVAAPIKGLVVSALLYNDPLDRPFGDVDILVGQHDLSRLTKIARQAGWKIVYDSKQLLTLNVILPPGIPMDVRASVGPPLFARIAATDMLRRAMVDTNPRVMTGPFWLLEAYDHLLLLMVDAVFDKLAFRSDVRKTDLTRALRTWITSPTAFANHAYTTGLATVAWATLRWLHEQTGDETALEVLAAFDHLPLWPHLVAARIMDHMQHAPFDLIARLGVRFMADEPVRSVAALALGAVGTARFYLRHGRKDPWNNVVWRGQLSE